MRYKTFARIVSLSGVCFVGLALYECMGPGQAPKARPDIVDRRPVPPPHRIAPRRSTTPSPEPSVVNGIPRIRQVDGDALGLAGRPISEVKAKDVFFRKPYKVKAFQDAGHTTINRLKLDLDRDGLWDEKWDFEGDKVKRHVATRDDEHYDQEFRLQDGHWVFKNAPSSQTPPVPGRPNSPAIRSGAADTTRQTPPSPPAVGTLPLGPLDADLLALRTHPVSDYKAKDVFGNRPYKVKAFQDDGQSSINRLKVDLDRDGLWDEKWTFSGDLVTRQRSTGDNETYDENYILDSSGWRKQ